MTPTDQRPQECEHYVDMLGYCELRDSWSMACNLCPYENTDEHCPDFTPKTEKDGK